MHTAAIIQARMTSSRLPGKVLMPLAGKPVLWHIVHRLRRCWLVGTIAIATSTNASDDPIEEFASREGVTVVRGPEDNVLERYWIAAKQLGADIIVRVTGDAPLVDPATVDYLVDALVRSRADYCVGDPQVPCIHEGFSPFTFRALQRLVGEAADDPVAREHVTAYFNIHPESFTVTYVPIDPDYQFSGARLSVDTPADLRFLEEVYARLNVPAGEADVRDVVRLLRSAPDLLKINAHVHQKSPTERSRRIIFRCDGDARLGLGHVVRCLALADELRDSQSCGVTFAMASGPVGFDLVRRANYPVEEKGHLPEEAWLEAVIRELQPDALVLDTRSEQLSGGRVEEWRSNGLVIITIDDPSERRLAADLAFYPPVPQVRKLDWTGFTGQLYVGWEWVVLRREFAQRPPRVPRRRPTVLVTMGGSDPAGLTLKAVEARDLLDDDFNTVIVLGPGFSYKPALERVLAEGRCCGMEVLEDVQDMSRVMAQADLAVTSFGVTAYELAAMGVPAIYLCLTEDHAASASALVEAGMGICLGLYTSIHPSDLAEAVQDLLHNEPKRLKMAERARQLVDGKGVERIASVIMRRLKDTCGCNQAMAGA